MNIIIIITTLIAVIAIELLWSLTKVVRKIGIKAILKIIKSPVKSYKLIRLSKISRLENKINKAILILDEKQRLKAARQDANIMNNKYIRSLINKQSVLRNKQVKIKKEKKIL